MAPTDSAPAISSNTFMKLPPEIRLQIYSYVLSAPPGVSLRLHDELSEVLWQRLDKSFPSINTALFRVNHEIHDEALPTFYAQNHFHWSEDDPYISWPIQFSNNFAMMRHLSLEYRDEVLRMLHVSSAAGDSDRSIEREIARLIKSANTFAVSLRTFTLYIASVPFPGPCFDLFMNGRVAFELQKFLPRLERLSIVAFGTEESYTALRTAIAPSVNWWSQVFISWPEATLPTAYATVTQRRAETSANKLIRAWSIPKPGFPSPIRRIVWDLEDDTDTVGNKKGANNQGNEQGAEQDDELDRDECEGQDEYQSGGEGHSGDESQSEGDQSERKGLAG